MMQRRNGVRGNALEEKRQAELEIREVNDYDNSFLLNEYSCLFS
jgi:hypothetical protein